MTATTTTTTPTGPHRGRPAGTRRTPRAATAVRAPADEHRRHEAGDLHDLAVLLAAPVTDDRRPRIDRALSLLLGPDAADAPHLVPDNTTPDVVRHRIAGRALAGLSARDLAGLSARDVTTRHLVSGALAILRG